MKNLTLFLLVITGIIACNKDDDNPGNPVEGAPKIEVKLPVNNSTYKNGDTLYVDALATDDKSLAKVALVIRHKQTGIELFRYDADAQSQDSFQIDTFYKVDSPIAATGIIRIEAEDHDAKKAEKEITITITN